MMKARPGKSGKQIHQTWGLPLGLPFSRSLYTHIERAINKAEKTTCTPNVICKLQRTADKITTRGQHSFDRR